MNRKKRFSTPATFLFFLLIAGLLCLHQPAQAAVISNGVYLIQMSDSDKILLPKSSAKGARVVLGSHNSSAGWKFKHLGDNYYQISYGSKVMDSSEGKVFNGVHIISYPWHGGKNQRWKLIPMGKYYSLINQQTGLALDLSGNRQNLGAGLQGYTRNGSRAQLFKLVPVGQGTKYYDMQ